MKKKITYILVVIVLVVVKLIVSELAGQSMEVTYDNDYFIVQGDSAQKGGSEGNEDQIIFKEKVQDTYDEQFVKTDREVYRDKARKLACLNRMNREQLMTIKGIGGVTADKILTYRRSKGAFKTLDDLMLVKGIGPKKYTSIEEQL